MFKYVNVILSSISVYATTSVYAFGVLAMVLVASGDVMLAFGIIAFGLISIVIALVALFRETRQVRAETKQVHVLVNSQHDAMVERVNQLTATLQVSNVAVPRAREGAKHG